MNADRQALTGIIAEETARPIGELAQAIVDEMRRRHGDVVAAVLFYGSCLRQADLPARDDPVFDFYVLVDRYGPFYANRLAALANGALPPNVFYIEVPWGGRRLRAKYAVVSIRQFAKAVSAASHQAYFWARFSQPCRIAYARDEAARRAASEALADAVVTMAAQTVGLMPDEFDGAGFWTRGFTETYRAELRSERGNRARLIYEADRTRYDRMLAPALALAGMPIERTAAGDCYRVVGTRPSASKAQATWRRRRAIGKLLSALRLIKGAFTFDGGAEYILWKIARHSGVRVDMTPWQRRHPLLAAPLIAWRLYRASAFR